MADLQEDPRPLVDISPPNVSSPRSYGVYRSPVSIDITRGSGGHYAAKKFQIDFYYDGPNLEKEVNSGKFSQELSPGPHKLDTRAIWFEGSRKEESEWVYINFFYVLTPPMTL